MGRRDSQLDGLSVLLWTELVLGFIVPLALFSIPDVRESKWALFTASCLVALSEVNGNPWTTVAELDVLAVRR